MHVHLASTSARRGAKPVGVAGAKPDRREATRKPHARVRDFTRRCSSLGCSLPSLGLVWLRRAEQILLHLLDLLEGSTLRSPLWRAGPTLTQQKSTISGVAAQCRRVGRGLIPLAMRDGILLVAAAWDRIPLVSIRGGKGGDARVCKPADGNNPDPSHTLSSRVFRSGRCVQIRQMRPDPADVFRSGRCVQIRQMCSDPADAFRSGRCVQIRQMRSDPSRSSPFPSRSRNLGLEVATAQRG